MVGMEWEGDRGRRDVCGRRYWDIEGQHGVILWVTQMRGLGGSMEIEVFDLFFKMYNDVLGSGDVCKVRRYMNRRPVVSWQ